MNIRLTVPALLLSSAIQAMEPVLPADRIAEILLHTAQDLHQTARALLSAAGDGNLELVQRLAHLSIINIPDPTDGATPLFIAAQNGQLEIVRSSSR